MNEEVTHCNSIAVLLLTLTTANGRASGEAGDRCLDRGTIRIATRRYLAASQEQRVKSIKMFGLAVAMTAAAMALIASSALATPTALCKSAAELPSCGESNQYPSGTSIEASSTNAAIETSIGKVTCSESSLKGKITASSGEPLPVELSQWSLAGCIIHTIGSPKCTVTEVGEPSPGSIAWKESGNGTLALSKGAAGEPGWALSCAGFINCTVTGQPSLDIAGGSITASNETLQSQTGPGKQCPKTASISGTYSVSSPSPVYVAKASFKTHLCSTKTSPCTGVEYPAGTAVTASSTNLIIRNNAADLSCNSSLSGEVSDASAGSVKITGWSLTGCTSTIGSCTTSSMNLPYSGSVFVGGGGNGTLAIGSGGLGSPEWHLSCAFFPCSGISIPSPVATLEGGNPAKLIFREVRVEPVGSCLITTGRLSATYNVTAPSPVFAEN